MATTTAAPGIGRKLKKILGTRTETPELRASLELLSSIYPENTPASRRALRSTIEDQGLEFATAFLSAVDSVVGALDAVSSNLDELSSTCQQAQDVVSVGKTVGAALLSEVEAAHRQLEDSRRRASLIDVFFEKYQLRPAQLAALTAGVGGAEDSLGPEFFEALAQVDAVRTNSRGLLVGRHQRAGLELMETMAGLQEAAYDRLCRWVHHECSTRLAEADGRVLDEDAPEKTLRAALRALRDRPVLLGYCVDEVAQARHAALFQRFIRALTAGPRPIEIQAADVRRYVGDMLAWIHAALEMEHDFLAGLLADVLPRAGEEGADDSSAGRGAVPDGGEPARDGAEADSDTAPGAAAGGAPPPPTLEAVLDKVFEGVCRPLKARLEQCLLTGPSPVLCYWVAQVLTFYISTLGRTLGHGGELPREIGAASTSGGVGSSLLGTLGSGRALALRAFREQLRQQKDKIRRYPPALSPDLAASPALLRAAASLSDLVACHGSALDAASADAGEGTGGFAALLDAAVEPALEVVARGEEALDPRSPARLDDGSHLDAADQRVFAINCLGALLAHVEGAPSAEALAARLRLRLADTVSTLVDAEAAKVLARCGLAEAAARVKLHQAGKGETALCDEPGMALATVSDAMRTFFTRVALPDVLPEFPKLQLPRVREELIHRVSLTLADAYATVYEAVLDPASGYDAAEAQASLRHTPAHARTLLGLQ